MSTSKEFPLLKSCDFVEPPLKKCRFGESENSKVRQSSEHLDVIENSKVTVSLEQLAAIESCLVTESSEQLVVIESSKVTESSEQLEISKVTESSEQLGSSKVTESSEQLKSSKVTESSEQLGSSKVTESWEQLKSSKVGESSEQLDVISFLSNNGETNCLVRSNGEFVSLNAIRGKNLFIWAVSLPSPCLEDSVPLWRFVSEAYPELCQAGFEMVVSVTVKRDKKLRFDKFISKLPCLSIPYPDRDTRNSVCSFINTHYKCTSYVDISVIVVDPAGVILPYDDIPYKILHYGFEWLTKNRNVRDIYVGDHVLKARLDLYYKQAWDRKPLDLPESITADVFDQPLSLHKDFLLCDPSRVLSRFNNQSLTVSELNKKHVALYLCLTGGFMDRLSKVYKQCIENNQELEVVLVCMPYFEERKSYFDDVIDQLKRYDLKSWFIFPFDNKVCFRLWRAFCPVWDEERLLILPPNCKSSGEWEGKAVIRRIGIKAYPFTRSAVLEQRFNTLKSLRPSSLFKGSSEKRTCLVRNGKNSNVRHSAIKGKRLILYFDYVSLWTDGGYLCQLLMKLYPKIRAKGCEVVFVPLDEEVGCPRHVDVAKMPWPMMPDEAAIKASVPDIFRFGDEDCGGNQLIVFGKDGKILSRRTKYTLLEYGFTKRIFHDNLRQEISYFLSKVQD